jgi:enamine deaminase RidA (YjgF/YER057c/UK114 family)
MTTPEDRLKSMGLRVPEVAKPVAAYVPAVRTGSYVYTSGQLPLVEGALAGTGKVGTDVDPERAKELAQICGLNALAAVRSVVGDLSAVTRVVKVVGFVASAPGFTGQPGVVNGVSELFGTVFGDAGVHARSAVGVTALPLDAPVEVEVVFEVA